MSKAPAMPLYWDAYLADTTHLTTEEHGAYLLLLAAMWRRNGSVPDDDRDNARILGLTPAKWRKVKARLTQTVSGFHVEGGTIWQEKLQKTWKNTQEKIDKNRENGARGGNAKHNKNNNLAQANGSVSLKRNSSIPEPEPDITLEPNGSKGADAPLVIDARKDAIWRRGVPFLCENGVPEKQAKSLIGRWLRDAGADAVFEALADARKAATGDPVPYITEILKPAPDVGDLVRAATKRFGNAK